MGQERIQGLATIIMILVVFGGGATVIAGLLQQTILASGLALLPTTGLCILGHGIDKRWLKIVSYVMYGGIAVALVAFVFLTK